MSVRCVAAIGCATGYQSLAHRFLACGSAVANGDELDALRKSLSELGYVDGKNVRIEA
jgi:hypothetical protein